MRPQLPILALLALWTTPTWSADETPPPRPNTQNGGQLQYSDTLSAVGIGVDNEGILSGELRHTLAMDATSALVGEAWMGDGAGGFKLSYNWIPDDGTGRPDRDKAIRKAFAALDQNHWDDRKLTLGGGLENSDGYLAGYLTHAVSGKRFLDTQTSTASTQIDGLENGRPYVDTIVSTTTTQRFERPFDWGVGFRASRFVEEANLRFVLGLDHEWGKNNARQTTFSAEVEKQLRSSPWSVAFRGELLSRDETGKTDNDETRAWVFLRYNFGKPSRRPATYPVANPTGSAAVTAEPSQARSADAAPKAVQTLGAAPSAPAGKPVDAVTPATPASSVSNLAGVSSAASGSGASSAPVIAGKASESPQAASVDVIQTAQPRTEKRLAKTTASISTDTYFKFDSAKLTSDATRVLYDVARTLNASGYAERITLTGHSCDIGPDAYNLRLSQRRADAVKGFLAKEGGIPDSDMLAIGKGEANPTYANSKAERHKNRRVDVEFLTYVTKEEWLTLPGEPAAAPTATTPPRSAAATPGVAASPAQTPTPAAGGAAPGTLPRPQASSTLPAAPATTRTAAPATPETTAPILWQREEVVLEPAWIQRGLLSTIAHKRTVDTYITVNQHVTTASSRVYLNRPPVASDDRYAVNDSLPMSLPVLSNDSDPDGDSLTITAVSAARLGLVSLSGNQITYTPPSVGAGDTDAFDYTISDGKGGSVTAHVVIDLSLNRAPLAADDAYSLTSPLPLAMPVLVNDSDPDGDPLTITAVSPAQLGTVSISGNQLSYVPSPGVLTGTDGFTYTISDGKGGSVTARVAVTINMPLVANKAPTAVDDTFVVSGTQPSVLKILSNDSDADGDPLSILSFTQPGVGTLTLNGDTLLFTPNGMFVDATFEYMVSDGKGGSDTAMVLLVDP